MTHRGDRGGKNGQHRGIRKYSASQWFTAFILAFIIASFIFAVVLNH